MQFISNRRGFTLIELLIVVAIIAILAAIAVPNFLEAQTRAKVSKAKADMRSMSTAIESYYVDYNNYVRSTYQEGAADVVAQYSSWSGTTAGNIVDGGFFQDLSTPVAYIANAYMEDPFSEVPTQDKRRYFRYTAIGKNAITGFSTSATKMVDSAGDPVLDDEGNQIVYKHGVAHDSSQSQIHAWVLWSLGPDSKELCQPMIKVPDGSDADDMPDYYNLLDDGSSNENNFKDRFDDKADRYFVQEIGENTSLNHRKYTPGDNGRPWRFLDQFDGEDPETLARMRAIGYMYNPENGTDSQGLIFQVGGGSVDHKNLDDDPNAIPSILQGIAEANGG